MPEPIYPFAMPNPQGVPGIYDPKTGVWAPTVGASGWKLVPREATAEMLWCGKECIDFDRTGQNTHEMEHESHTSCVVDGEVIGHAGTTLKQDMQEAWAAMLAAAPTGPTP